jgi:hypothetical protein
MSRSIIGIMLISESSGRLPPRLIVSTLAPAMCGASDELGHAPGGEICREKRRELSLWRAVGPDLDMEKGFGVPWGKRLREGGAAEMALSALVHGALLFMFAMAMASLDVSEREGLARGDVDAMRSYLRAAAVGSEERGDDPRPGEALSDGKPGLGDAPHAPAGRARPAARPATGSSRADAIREAREFGVIGLLAAGAASDVRSVWDEGSGDGVLGALWGSALDESLAPSGAGQGGGGRADVIGVGGISTRGCEDHRCTGTVGGHGTGTGRIGGQHVVRSPVVRCGTYEDARGKVHETCATQVNGRLPPEVIQRIIHQNHGRFLLCYENGLRTSPGLMGRVVVKFVIGRDGSVVTAAEGESDMLGADVRACVVRAFMGLSFPQPEGGIVTVVYPLLFTPE